MADKDEDDVLTIHIDGKPYRIDEFELHELEYLERETGASYMAIDYDSVTVQTRIVWLIRRRSDPNASLADVGKLTIKQLGEVTKEPDPPKPAAKAGKKDAGS